MTNAANVTLIRKEYSLYAPTRIAFHKGAQERMYTKGIQYQLFLVARS